MASVCLLALGDTDKQIGSRAELKLGVLIVFARLRVALERFLCFGSTAERDSSSKLVKQPLWIFVEPFSLGSLLLGPKETGITKGLTSPGNHLLSQPVTVFRYSWRERRCPRMPLPRVCRGTSSCCYSHLTLPTPEGPAEQGKAQSPAPTVLWEARKPVLADSGVADGK